MSLITPSRRGFIGGLAALFAAPAIVRASSLMPISQRALLEVAPLALDMADSMSYQYWVLMSGTIVKRSAREILDAPSGVYQPWLPEGHGSGVQFRPVDSMLRGLELRREHLNLIRAQGSGWTTPSGSEQFLHHEAERLRKQIARIQKRNNELSPHLMKGRP